jgi:hypothetical protein
MSFFRNNDVKKHLGRTVPRFVSNPEKPTGETTETPLIKPDEEGVRQQELTDGSTNPSTV